MSWCCVKKPNRLKQAFHLLASLPADFMAERVRTACCKNEQGYRPRRATCSHQLCIYIKNHHPAEVLARFSKLPPGKAAVSAVTYGELCFGAEKSSKPKETRQILEHLTALIPVLPLDAAASVHYGKIRRQLQTSGKLIGNNDLWIAAHALAGKLILVTSNVAELKRVPGLKVENWVG